MTHHNAVILSEAYSGCLEHNSTVILSEAYFSGVEGPAVVLNFFD
jgi:hypothetical protein